MQLTHFLGAIAGHDRMSVRHCFPAWSTCRVPYSDGKTLADRASSWMQVVFSGLGVTIAMVAAVIAYFAWVQPQAAGDGDGPTMPAVVPTAGAGMRVALGELTPAVGAGNIRRSGDDLVIHCATGQSSDRERVVEYDLLGRYTAMEAELRVVTARDTDTRLQLRIVADGPEIAAHTLTKGKPARLNIALTGKQKMRFQLSCQFADGEMTLGDVKLIHS